jgi:hypothetical protein
MEDWATWIQRRFSKIPQKVALSVSGTNSYIFWLPTNHLFRTLLVSPTVAPSF